MTQKYVDLKAIMSPKTVAIIGATATPNKIGHVIMQNFIDVGFSGKIFPVNINNQGTIMGFKAYKSILEVGQNVDLAVIAIPAPAVAEALEECGKAHVGGVIVISAGFAEVGNVELEKELEKVAKKYSLPVIGPNCLGVMDLRSRINTLFLPSYKLDRPKLGNISFASQSGAVGSAVLDEMMHEGFGLARFISYGNAAVVDEVDVLNYLVNDEETKVIIFYIEGVKRGKEFVEIARKATKIKPIVIIKGGTSATGMQAAHSHTAALVSDYEAYDAVFRQFGFTAAKDLRELLNYAKVLSGQPLSTGNRVAILTNGGGMGVLATDAVAANDLKLAQLTKETEATLRKQMPPIVNICLPLDVGGDADDKRFGDALDALEADPGVDALVVVGLFQTPGADSRVAAKLIQHATGSKKPMVVISMGGNYTEMHKIMMESAGLPVYPSPNDAASALAALISYSRYKEMA
jgi:acetyl coenzyme A synthetase (ADP forming)-like protein